ncbi:MAG: TRIC cation channel family protein, partial [Hydrogenovibrio sp.]|nr:TRIC cation channel family protein [Hydrogenovibrio sp.]
MSLIQTLYFLDLLGTIVFAITGLLAAGGKQLDLFGALFIALVTAVGGGTLRDLILGQPVFWVQHNIYIYLVIGATLFVFFYSKRSVLPMKLLLYLDALGLAVFTV